MKLRITGLLLFSFTIAYSQSNLNFTLQEAQAFAVKNAYSVKNQELEVKKTKQIVNEVRAIGLPQISGNVNFNNYLDIPVQVIPNFLGNDPEFLEAQFGLPYTASAGVNAQQLLFDGSYIIGLMAARVAKELTDRDYEKSKIEIQEAVAQAYHAVLTLAETEDILKENLEFLRKNLFETQELFKAGFLEEQDADQLELLVSSLENNLLNIRNQLRISRMFLNYQMGLNLEDQVVLSDAIETLLTKTSNDGGAVLAETFQLENHIDFRKIQTQERAAFLQMRNQQMEFLPKLSAGYTYSQNYFDQTFNPSNTDRWFPTQFWNLGLQVPIFSSGLRSSRVRQARFDLAMVDLAKTQISDGLRIEYERAKADYEFGLESYQMQVRNAELAKRILNRTATKYSEGLESSLNLTQAQNQLLDSQRQMLDAASSLLNARVRLEKVLGKYNP
ncbi:MAG: TolC family protein [Schleiferiaceae bacterium]|nr:TolC family protein [Schleiferiaceae bacterium]